MNWVEPEERRRKINGHLTEVKGTASRMGFASGAQQLPNNLEQKNYNHTDEKRERESERAFRSSGAVSGKKQANWKNKQPKTKSSEGGTAISLLWKMCSNRCNSAFGLLQMTQRLCNGINNRRICHHATLHPITPGVIFCTQEP